MFAVDRRATLRCFAIIAIIICGCVVKNVHHSSCVVPALPFLVAHACASYCSSVVAQFRSCHFTHVMTKCNHSCGKPVYESVAGWHSPQTSFCVLAKMRHALLLRYNPHIQEHQSVHARHYAVENVSVHKHALALLPPLCA